MKSNAEFYHESLCVMDIYCLIVSGKPKRDTVTRNSVFRSQYRVEGVVWKGEGDFKLN